MLSRHAVRRTTESCQCRPWIEQCREGACLQTKSVGKALSKALSKAAQHGGGQIRGSEKAGELGQHTHPTATVPCVMGW